MRRFTRSASSRASSASVSSSARSSSFEAATNISAAASRSSVLVILYHHLKEVPHCLNRKGARGGAALRPIRELPRRSPPTLAGRVIVVTGQLQHDHERI